MLYISRLKELRKAKKVSQDALAKVLGKSRIIVNYWENGKSTPCDSDIRMIAHYFGVLVQDISDLPEGEVFNRNTLVNFPEQNIAGIDNELMGYGHIPDETIRRVKSLQESCIRYRSMSTRQQKDIAKYEKILRGLPFLVYTKDKRMKYTYVSDSFIDLVSDDLNRESIIGNASGNYFSQKDYMPILALEQSVFFNREQITDCQVFIPGSSGKRLGLLTIVPIIDKNEVESIICSIEDITHTYREEKMRKELENVVGKIDQCIWIGEKTKVNEREDPVRFTYFSRNCEDFLGVTKQQLIDGIVDWRDNIIEEDLERLNHWFLEELCPKKIAFRVMVDNKEKWISNEVFMEDDIYFGILTDITESRNKVSKMEGILATLNAAGNAVIVSEISDEGKEFMYISKAVESMYGESIRKLKKNPEFQCKYIHPEDLDKFIRESGKIKKNGILNYRLKLSNGDVKDIEENRFFVKEEKTVYMGQFFCDVTNRKV